MRALETGEWAVWKVKAQALAESQGLKRKDEFISVHCGNDIAD